MLTDPRPNLEARSPQFVAVHRLIAEVMAGRTVALRDGERTMLAAPLDGGDVLSPTLAIAGCRAAYLGLPDAPTLLEAPAPDHALLWRYASGLPRDIEGAGVAQGGLIAAAAAELAKLAERLPAMTLAPGHEVPRGTLCADAADVLAYRRTLAGTVEAVATAPVPLASGATATVTAFRDAVGGIVSAVIVGKAEDGVLVRVHSSCITGDVFGSLKCDCGAQLQLSLDRIASDGGVLLYMAQEGRGIGLVNKLRAYDLQQQGLDTVDANVALGYHDDERDYALAAAILRKLGLSRVRLMTNNPSKAAGLAVGGLAVEPEPLRGPVTAHNAKYLDTKRERSGHTL
ncbi:MAG: GTP cyclohydrolase II [Pseudomonadota bacterium]